MPKTSAKSLATKKAYNARPENKKKRAENNRARRAAIKAGRAKKGDGKDVHHVKMQAKTGAQKNGKTKVVSRKANRGWRKKNPGMYGKAKK